ncbi:hypothetical protein [Paenibacillus pinistramenti]|uniref:hypothetical protein n=1 Tax=Paenibacillus pinistramenti TaxID=1768003 RepID=UPI001109A41A|nr:hypothetical protein [Paenibacillus pinistramenti]
MQKNALFLLCDLTMLEKLYSELVKQIQNELTMTVESELSVELHRFVAEAEEQDPELKCFFAVQLYLALAARNWRRRALIDDFIFRLSAPKGRQSDFAKLLISNLEKDPVRMAGYVEELNLA